LRSFKVGFKGITFFSDRRKVSDFAIELAK
jgi:hypothetical protein